MNKLYTGTEREEVKGGISPEKAMEDMRGIWMAEVSWGEDLP